jgi:hypothetical protein
MYPAPSHVGHITRGMTGYQHSARHLPVPLLRHARRADAHLQQRGQHPSHGYRETIHAYTHRPSSTAITLSFSVVNSTMPLESPAHLGSSSRIATRRDIPRFMLAMPCCRGRGRIISLIRVESAHSLVFPQGPRRLTPRTASSGPIACLSSVLPADDHQGDQAADDTPLALENRNGTHPMSPGSVISRGGGRSVRTRSPKLRTQSRGSHFSRRVVPSPGTRYWAIFRTYRAWMPMPQPLALKASPVPRKKRIID